MPVVKHAYPILEYDTETHGIIRPNRHHRGDLPSVCVMTFFSEVLDRLVQEHPCEIANSYGSESGTFPAFVTEYKGVQLCLIRADVGSAAIAMMADFLFGYGVQKLIVCGGCGVLCDIPAGDVIVPTVALRDEGASYHYLPPSRDIALDVGMVEALSQTLRDHGVPYVQCKTWTTDGFYRETPDMITYRKEEGCQVVEMECATLAAVAQFRGVKFGQLLYSGDILVDYDNYDERDWVGNCTARETLFSLAMEAAVKVGNKHG
jgi:uridine phosphorylase